MNNSKCIVKAHPDTKEVITKWEKDGKSYGRIRIDQAKVEFINGFGSVRNRSAFLTMEAEALESLGLVAGQEFPVAGKIVRKETREPQYEGHNPKINPTTAEIHLVNGAPVYFQDTFTSNMSENDSLIAATPENVEATEEVSAEAQEQTLA